MNVFYAAMISLFLLSVYDFWMKKITGIKRRRESINSSQEKTESVLLIIFAFIFIAAIAILQENLFSLFNFFIFLGAYGLIIQLINFSFEMKYAPQEKRYLRLIPDKMLFVTFILVMLNSV
ncbi:hypothetical protein CEY16_07065 [Halalkalibacillus sediminis]|uniref:DUF4181 domain-containing protein n=1 Tax=Halalkalibacillus sediminis TaxID=2018042 RepID=A0A2I0QTN2_9BACI|nr:hypothetical protein [Halalkalibacillus sediminis]PKR77686.1 hypothetical protein CEY16_07065 [Halalkalibacillus sediminis]